MVAGWRAVPPARWPPQPQPPQPSAVPVAWLTPAANAAAAGPQVQMPEGDVVAVDSGDVHPGGQVVDVEYKDLK
jgi:hypothetical protein